MTQRLLSTLFALPLCLSASLKATELTSAQEALAKITVYKSASCGCCKTWIKHLENNGFEVTAHDVDLLTPYKDKAKLAAGLGSCHTAFIDGYAIEGHVPASDISKLIENRPDISGISVPGMPIGSPGMEVEGRSADEFDVIGYKDGEIVEVFNHYPEGSTFKD